MDRRSFNMEEIREVSFAHYEKLTPDRKLQVLNAYEEMDSDGNGTVTLQECSNFLTTEGYSNYLPTELFNWLDVNHNGILDYQEWITLLYMIVARLVNCNGVCGKFLWGTYFLCVQCYETGNNPYHLCCSCYRYERFTHHHSAFMDNYALLRMKRRVPSTPALTAAPIHEGAIQNFSYGRSYSTSSVGTQDQNQNSIAVRANSFSSSGTQFVVQVNTGGPIDRAARRREKFGLALQVISIVVNIAAVAATGMTIIM